MNSSSLFISYSHADKPFVLQLYQYLTAQGFDVWWDEAAMESRGRTFLQELRDAIAGVDRLVLVITPEAVQSDYVRAEWEFALKTCTVIVPILREGDENLVPGPLKLLHWADMRSSRPYGEATAELVRLLWTPLLPLAVLHGVDALPEHYLPRAEQLDAVMQTLLSDLKQPTAITTAGRTAALRGMGGVGKSVLAAALARACETRRAFTDGVVWLRVGQQRSDLTGHMRLLGQVLGDDQTQYYTDEQSSRLRLTRLLADKVCLLILDDVWDVGQAEPFANALGPRCRLLITTRDGGQVTALGAQEVQLGVLSDDQALALLSRWSSQPVNQLPAIARQVAEECGNLPLALAMIGAMVRSRPDRWDNALHKLRQADLAHIAGRFPNYEHPSLLRAIQVSLDALVEGEVQQRFPNVQTRYLDFAVFPEDTPVPESVLAVFWAPFGLDRYQVQDIVDFLVDRSLVQRDDDNHLTLHDLQLDYVRSQVDDLPARHNALLDAYTALCHDSWASGPDDGYYFQHLAGHLAKAGRIEDLRALLLDFRWLQAKLDATDVITLLRDFDHLPHDMEVRLIHEAIKRSAQILQHDRTQLAGQLSGRLLSRREPVIQALLEQAARWREAPWLRPLTAALTPPGDPLLFTLAGHAGTVRSIAISADGHWGITAGNSHPDRTVRLWDLANGVELLTLPDQADPGGYNPVGLLSDGRWALVAHSSDIHVWNVATGEKVSSLQGHNGHITSLAVAASEYRAISAAGDGSLIVWDLINWQVATRLPLQPEPADTVGITPDGRYAVTLSASAIKHWDLERRQETAMLPWQTGSLSWFERPTLALSADGRRVFFGSPLHVWYVEKQAAKPVFAANYRGQVLAVTSDGRTALTRADDEVLEVWDTEQGVLRSVLPGQGSSIATVALTPDGETLVTALYDHYIKVWALEFTAPSIVSRASVDGVAITPDGRWAIASKHNDIVAIWNLNTGQPLLASSARNAVEQAVHTAWQQQNAQIDNADSFIRRHAGKGSAPESSVEALAKRIDISLKPRPRPVVAASNDTRAITYIPETAKTSEEEESGLPSERYALRLWDLTAADGDPLTLMGHSSPIMAVAMTPDGRRAVSGSIGRTLRVWDLEIGRELQTLRGHRSIVWDVQMTPDGRYAVSASEDRTVRVWNLHRWQCIAIFTGDLPMKHCAVSNDARAIAAYDSLGRSHLLRLEEN